MLKQILASLATAVMIVLFPLAMVFVASDIIVKLLWGEEL